MEIEHPNKRVDCTLRIVAHDEVASQSPRGAMTPVHRVGLGHSHAPPLTAPQPARNGDEITAPLPDYGAPVASTWQARPTLPLADAATAVRPALPFHAPAAPAPLDVAPVAPSHVQPVAAPRKRSGLYAAMAAGALALYSAVLVALVVPRRTVDAPLSAAPVVSATMPSVEPTASASAGPPAPSVSASAAAPPAIPPHPAPLRTPRPPAPARTAQPRSDVVNPWIYD